jgi:hypothetical protein
MRAEISLTYLLILPLKVILAFLEISKLDKL